jgi:chitinase
VRLIRFGNTRLTEFEDVDYEDMTAMNAQDGSAEKWLVDFTKALRVKLPSPKYIITHAPVAPWFSDGKYKSGAYLTVDKEAGSLIDWYNLQFYNQGATEYTTCDGLFTKSSSQWPKSSVFEIHASGVDLNKLVVGKPAGQSDATNGFMDSKTLAGCVADAKGKGWNAGAMVWQYPNAKADWAQTVRGSAFPASGGGSSSPPPPSEPSQPPQPAQPPAGGKGTGSCSAAAWSSSATYTQGQKASFNGHIYTAQW